MESFSVSLLVMLLPGVFCAVLAEHLTTHPKWNQFRFLLYSLLMGFLIYGIMELGLRVYGGYRHFFNNEYVIKHLQFWESLLTDGNLVYVNEIIVAMLLSVVVACVFSAIKQRKLLLVMAKKLKISQKCADENLYDYFLDLDEINVVWVRDFKNNLTYEGIVKAYSTNDGIKELMLRNVKVYRYNDSAYVGSSPAVYLLLKENEFSIEEVDMDYEIDV